MIQFPMLSYITILYPSIRIGCSQRNLQLRILNEHCRMRFHLAVHDLTLVNNDILYAQSRRNQFPARSIMIEFPTWQRKHSYTQLVQFFVFNARMFAQSQTELRIHIIESKFAIFIRAFHQQFHRTIAQQPNPDIHQEQMRLHQSAQFFYRRFLQHIIQFVRITTGRNKHTMVFRQIRIYPQTIANHIRFRNLLQRFGRTDIHIATRNQCMQ